MPSADAPAPRSRSSSPELLHADSNRLHHTHSTLGYRAGISASKPLHVQRGFDESYPLGARLGLRIGWLFGVLSALPQTERVVRTRKEAEVELAEEKVFGKEWWESDGVWKWEVHEHEGDVTLEEVVEAWPVWVQWRDRVRELAAEYGLTVRFTEVEGMAEAT